MYAICFEKKILPKNSPAMAGPDLAPMEMFESSLVCMFYHTQQLNIDKQFEIRTIFVLKLGNVIGNKDFLKSYDWVIMPLHAM